MNLISCSLTKKCGRNTGKMVKFKIRCISAVSKSAQSQIVNQRISITAKFIQKYVSLLLTHQYKIISQSQRNMINYSSHLLVEYVENNKWNKNQLLQNSRRNCLLLWFEICIITLHQSSVCSAFFRCKYSISFYAIIN